MSIGPYYVRLLVHRRLMYLLDICDIVLLYMYMVLELSADHHYVKLIL